MDPTQDDYQLWLRGGQAALPMTVEQEEFISTPSKIPSLPWGIDGKSKNIWAKGPVSDPSSRPIRAETRLLLNTNSATLERLLRFEDEREKGRAIVKIEAEAPKLPQYAPIVSLPEEFHNLSVNEIFQICFERCLARGKAEEEEERIQEVLEEAQQVEEDESNIFESSPASSEACSEDLPFISSANLVSIRKREIQRKRTVLGTTRKSPSSADSPTAETAADGGDLSFVSVNSDPEQVDDTPLFTIRSKKQPIKIVDPKTLQRPDKIKSSKDLANDVDFLKRGLRVLGTGGDLVRDAYNMFRVVGMDNTILDQTSKWLRQIQIFVKDHSAILQKGEVLRQVESRNSLFEDIGQMMLHKKKTDNLILGWTNFAISMFPVVETMEGIRSVPDTDSSGTSTDDPKEKTSSKVSHMHSKACLDMNHELHKLTEGNRLKFKTLLKMLIESLGECKDWLIKAPSYAKVKPSRYTEFRSIDSPMIPSIEIEPPFERGRQGVYYSGGKQVISEQKTRLDSVEQIVIKTENEKTVEGTLAVGIHAGESKGNTEYSQTIENPQYCYQTQQAAWYPANYAMQGYTNQQTRVSGNEYIQNSSTQVLRPRSSVSQPMNADPYHQSQVHTNYQQEATNKQMQRNQHNISRGRQGTRSGAHSRNTSAAGARQTYGSHQSSSHPSQQYSGFSGPASAGEYAYNHESGAYHELRFSYAPATIHLQGVNQQPVLQHPQPWRSANISSTDNTYLDANHPQQFAHANAQTTPEQIIGSGEFMRQDRNAAAAAAAQSQRSMTVTPQMLQHSGLMLQHHHGSADQYASAAAVGAQGFPQSGPPGVYSPYSHATWHAQHAHQLQLQQQAVAQGRGGQKGPAGQAGIYQTYSHHPGQFR
ncbi:hypothetical protein ABW20_dc0109439 [Dactylellina cionopaga]|nr:hypothetical protein ABW20_dc0109439 [Dactylellina cionopaga]